ncbi:SSU ribosomal protein S1P [Cereibacter ovatus]|uniref:Small ribosomal subunit protein bS1 n=1 Tax=Cereibacter ovatus TaxID=439529 RepID=A0A285CX70_9RHOB|nr:30S ribosomal protein S1 [Cereibacter ovatus]SNX71668.1 SSU ribosomal protein S1P [Cereibacter ovatus]
MCAKATMEEFEALLNESLQIDTPQEGSVVKGRVIAVEAGQAIIDVGYKMEGRVDLKEFADMSGNVDISVGDEVEVYLDRVENARGEAVISRDKAKREEAWDRLEKAYANETRVEGAIFGRVKGGFTVDLGGAVAFLPGSQVDVRPVRDAGPLMGMKQPFQILKMDRRRGNIVVSRRAILEESRAEQRAEVISNLFEGQTVDGVVKNITEYGAFVDLGGVDGLLHVTDMAWRRVNHPSEILSIGETVKVQVIKINKETHRISLGMKQLQSDPWDAVEKAYPIGSVHKGRVTNITDYGAFVELEAGVEGLVHVSEMSWTKKNVHPGKIVSTSQEVDVMVLEIDSAKRRVSLGLKQTMRNPWEVFAETHPVGTAIEGEVKNITEFGLFVGLDHDIDGMVHLSDLSWDQRGEEAIQNYRKGDVVKAVVTEVDIDKERISLSIKALGDDTFTEAMDGVKRGSIVTVTVTAIEDGGVEVEYNGAKSFIRRSDLSRDRADQRPERFQIGDKVDVRVTNVDPKTRRLGLSIKAREIAEEKEAVEQYGSSDSGASLGDILGAARRCATANAADLLFVDGLGPRSDAGPFSFAIIPRKSRWMQGFPVCAARFFPLSFLAITISAEGGQGGQG